MFDCSMASVKTCLDSQTALHVPQYFMINLDPICHGGLDDWQLVFESLYFEGEN